jgi:Bacteriophage Mu Gp45 spike protein
MHRATPVNSSFRAYTSGGARTCINQADDSKLMQEMAGNFMKAETRSKIESPQNYGFTSVVMDADKDSNGQMTGSAEGFITFPGGNRSFAVCGVMDDRRHRLKGLEKGDVAMFRTKDDQQQFHMTQDGGYWSGPDSKTLRMQLVPQQQQQQGQQGQQGQNGQGQGQQQKGQSPVYKDGQNSALFFDVTKDATRASGKMVKGMLDDGKTYLHLTNQQAYVGGESGKDQFAPIMTSSGPSDNSFARISAATAERYVAEQAAAASLLDRVAMLEAKIAALEARLV